MQVRRLRKLERTGLQLNKLHLDVKYFEDCLELGVCPKFLDFKMPNLSAFKNGNRSAVLNIC